VFNLTGEIGSSPELLRIPPLGLGFKEEEDELHERFEKEDPVAKLRQLKEMLDSDLITEAEYQKKKEEILSRM
jgi:hypothetical protein